MIRPPHTPSSLRGSQGVTRGKLHPSGPAACAAACAGLLAVLLLAPEVLAQERGQERSPERRAATDTMPALSATLIGQVVSAADGRPVHGAVVNVLGSGRGAITDSTGNFRIPQTLPGVDSIEVRFIGYEPSKVELDLAPEATTRVVFLLSPTVVRVADIEVEVRRAAARRGKLRGFWERRDRGFGAFITPAEVESKLPRQTSDLLRGIPGVRVGPSHMGRAPVTMGRHVRDCPPNIFLDGTLVPNLEVDDIPAADVWAIELYRGASDMPIEFNRGQRGCGAIVVWTPTGERLD